MNKKGRNRGVVLSVATVLAAGTLAAGCNNQDTSGAKKGAEAQQTEPKRGSITVSIYDRNNIPPEEGNWDKNRWTEWVNKHGPVDVKYVPVPRWESLQKFNALFASAAAPDLILEYDTNYRNQWYAQKLLMPLDELIDKHSTIYKELMSKVPLLKKLGTKDDGKLYEIGRVTPLTTNHAIYIREDWLQKLKLEAPKTTEELLQIAKAFANRDPDGNGKKDTFGVNLSGNGFTIVNHMFGHGLNDWDIQSDRAVHEWDRLKASVAFQKSLFDAGLVDKDFLTDKNGEKAKQDFLSGKLGMYLHQALSSSDYDTFKKNNPNGKIAILPLPKSEFGQFSPVLGAPVQMIAAVNAKAADPKAVIQYIDFMVKPENAIVIKNGIEGVHWRKGSNGCPQKIDPEKNKKEVYTADLNMLTSEVLFGKCAFGDSIENPSATDKALSELNSQAKKAYISKERPVPSLNATTLPLLPDALSIVVKNVEKQIGTGVVRGDIWMKAIVNGPGFTADQALGEAKAVWEQAGGAKVDEFYAKWYTDNKNALFLLDDLYAFDEQIQQFNRGRTDP
ncbi:extracellular solute-binding protein [Paenibacillus tyrfis]|uniref:extracellular solute-binding protein n=1 Tax=Paenibacillus tyrfis TaxID=1501230 RepID=UPI00209D5A6C|nr:extracellular solute-binding protein [Paenibacillus tyrfis]MCP1307963.1 extracellular solute-binding protein [Paenibacillus tyrfis]